MLAFCFQYWILTYFATSSGNLFLPVGALCPCFGANMLPSLTFSNLSSSSSRTSSQETKACRTAPPNTEKKKISKKEKKRAADAMNSSQGENLKPNDALNPIPSHSPAQLPSQRPSGGDRVSSWDAQVEKNFHFIVLEHFVCPICVLIIFICRLR